MAAEFQIDHDRGWLVVTITRPRRGDKPPRVRHVYLSPDEAAQLAGLLALELERINRPAVTG